MVLRKAGLGADLAVAALGRYESTRWEGTSKKCESTRYKYEVKKYTV